MKILHVVPSMGRSQGGPSDSVPMTAMAQKAAGLEVAIAFCEYGKLSLRAEEAERRGVRLIKFKGRQSSLNCIAFSIDFLLRFASIAAEYDVIHTHAQWLFPVWWAAHVARRLGKKLVMMPRGSFEPERLRKSAWKKKLVGWIDKHYAICADSIWATAESEADGVRLFAPQSHVEVFPIGLNFESYSLSRQAGKTLLFFSRISPIKGLDMLAEAWSRVNDSGWKLLIVGPDDRGYTEEIKKVFERKCPGGSYEFRGPVYGDDKFRLLSSVDGFILPTRNENWGIAVAEAMASGLPTICSKGAPWRCLERERAGWWTDINVQATENALKELMSLTREQRLKMGANGRRWVEDNLSWEKIGNAMKASYEKCIK